MILMALYNNVSSTKSLCNKEQILAIGRRITKSSLKLSKYPRKVLSLQRNSE